MSSKGGASSSSNTDSGSYSGGGGSGGSNQSAHDERQAKLDKKAKELEAKAKRDKRYADAAERLREKQKKEDRKFELKTTGVEEGRHYVQSRIDAQRYGAGKAYGEGKISEKRLKETEMFGEEASKYTNEYLEKSGVAKGSALWKELKYGISNSAMGSGDPTGIMTSTAISSSMHQRQKKIKAMTLAALSFSVPMGAGTLMRMSAADAWKNKGQAGYDQYLNKFYSNMAGTTSSYGVKSKGTGNGKEQEVSSSNITETRTDTKKSLSNETRFTSLKAVTKGGGTVTDDADRTLLKRSGKTIKAKIVST